MNNRWNIYIVLLLILLCGYWYLLYFSNRYDFIDCWLPWRHFISKSFHNGIIPLWNPYQQLGYPIYADLQGPLFSIENFITGNLVTINLKYLQIILLGYLYIGIIGFYELGLYLFNHQKTAIACATSYIFGGIVIYHFQHFYAVISFCLLPITIVVFLKFLDVQKLKYGLLLIVLLHLHYTTGNHTFNLINFHFIVFFICRKTILLYKLNEKKILYLFIKKILALAIGIAMIILPVLVAYVQNYKMVSRYGAISYAESTENAVSIPSLISFINPLQSNMPYDYMGTDQAMSNYFIGFISIICFLLFTIYTQQKYKWWYIGCIIFIVLISFGSYTPIHKILFTMDPLLRLFRFPSYYMIYAHILIILCSGYFLKDVFVGVQSISKIIIGLVINAILLFIIAFSKGINLPILLQNLKNKNIFIPLKIIKHSDSFLLSLSFCCIILCTILLVLIFKKNRNGIVLLAIILDSILGNTLNNLQLNNGESTKAIDHFLRDQPKNFVPTVDKLYNTDSLILISKCGMTRNIHGFYNVISPEFFNSFYLKNYKNLDSNEAMFLALNKRPFVTAIQKCTFKNVILEPNTISFECNDSAANEYEFKQLYHKNWHIYINEKRYLFIKDNVLKCKIPAGENKIKIVFENDIAISLFWLTMLLSIMGTIGFLYLQFTKKIFVITTIFLLLIFTKCVLTIYNNKNLQKPILKTLQVNIK